MLDVIKIRRISLVDEDSSRVLMNLAHAGQQGLTVWHYQNHFTAV